MDSKKVRTIIGSALSLTKIATWKIRYRKKIHIPWIQNLGKNVAITIGDKGYMRIGVQTVAMSNCSITSSGYLSIGNKCFLNQNCTITCMEKIRIGNNCSFANNVVIVDHDHNYRIDKEKFICAPIEIGNDVWIGANCTILKGVSIGDHSVVAAGSTVRKSIPPHSVYYEKKEYCCKEYEGEIHDFS